MGACCGVQKNLEPALAHQESRETVSFQSHLREHDTKYENNDGGYYDAPEWFKNKSSRSQQNIMNIIKDHICVPAIARSIQNSEEGVTFDDAQSFILWLIYKDGFEFDTEKGLVKYNTLFQSDFNLSTESISFSEETDTNTEVNSRKNNRASLVTENSSNDFSSKTLANLETAMLEQLQQLERGSNQRTSLITEESCKDFSSKSLYNIQNEMLEQMCNLEDIEDERNSQIQPINTVYQEIEDNAEHDSLVLAQANPDATVYAEISDNELINPATPEYNDEKIEEKEETNDQYNPVQIISNPSTSGNDILVEDDKKYDPPQILVSNPSSNEVFVKSGDVLI